MITVRKVTPADTPLVIAYLEKRAAFERQLGCFPGKLETSVERMNEALFGTPVFAYAWLATSSSMSVGFVLFHYQFSSLLGRPRLWLDDLYVDSNARRGGAGLALLEAVAREATSHHCTNVAWTADEKNHLGVLFFAKIGALVTARHGTTLTYSVPTEVLTSHMQQMARAQQPEAASHSRGEVDEQDVARESRVSASSGIRVYRTLVSADTYRDGGSLEVRFACADGSFETIWLQAALDPEFGVRYVHTDLSVYADASRQEGGRRIAKNSFEEEAIVSAMLRFLRNPKVDVPFSHRTPDEHYLKTVEALIESIPNRMPAGEDTGGKRMNL